VLDVNDHARVHAPRAQLHEKIGASGKNPRLIVGPSQQHQGFG
jgi:hypothetical protein